MKKITIIGIGLIGSSIARALREYNSDINICIIDSNQESLKKSKLLNLGNIFSETVDISVEESDIIFICTPISSYENILRRLSELKLKNTIITDVGSSKVKIINPVNDNETKAVLGNISNYHGIIFTGGAMRLNDMTDEIKKHLRLKGFKKYKIILEPAKRNTAPAILSSALIKEIPENQPLIFLTSDHLIEKTNLFNKSIKKHQKYLTDKNIFIFGIKPSNPSSEFGYFLSNRVKNKYKVIKFFEKP